MVSVIDSIIHNKTHCYFISPHLDDAVLSAGGLLSYLASKTPVTIVNVFSAPGEKPYTFVAKRFLKQCGFEDVKELYKARHKEESNITKALGVTSINLGYIDGTFRRKRHLNALEKILVKKIPEFDHLYPAGRILFGLAKEDSFLKNDLKLKLQNSLKNEKNYALFAPIGKVEHMDHVITKQVCAEVFPNCIFWTDFPYIKNVDRQLAKNEFLWDKNLNEKKKLISMYTSQVAMLFPKGKIEIQPEIYTTNLTA